MKYVLPILVISILSCGRNRTDCIRPYTHAELEFIDSIEQLGQKVRLKRFNYQLNEDTEASCIYDHSLTYAIHISELDSNVMNDSDSRKNACVNVLKTLYTNVIDDSILFYTRDFYVSLTRKQYKPIKKTFAPSSNDYCFSIECTKQDLENLIGWKVVKGDKGLVRIEVPNKVDTLVISKEIFLPRE